LLFMLKPRVQVRKEGDVLVAEFWDCLRLDPAPVQELRQQFDEHLRNKGRPELVVDLSGVGFAGSAALGGFLGMNRVARQNGGRVVFCRVDPSVYEVFRISQLVPLFIFVPDIASALALVNSEPAAPGERAAEPAPAAPPATDGQVSARRASAPLRRSRRGPS
jgi:anti-anti-sigma factor